MKKILILLMIMCLTFSFVGCTEYVGDTNYQLEQKTEKIMQQAVNEIGMPNIQNFTEKKLLKDIYELCDDAELITYAYTQNMNGEFVYIGQCIGYGVPYSTQFSNPESYYSQGVSLPQAEPNGIFKPEGLSATWLVVVNPETGKREVEYWEPEIIVKQSKLPARLCKKESLPSDY